MAASREQALTRASQRVARRRTPLRRAPDEVLHATGVELIISGQTAVRLKATTALSPRARQWGVSGERASSSPGDEKKTALQTCAPLYLPLRRSHEVAH